MSSSIKMKSIRKINKTLKTKNIGKVFLSLTHLEEFKIFKLFYGVDIKKFTFKRYDSKSLRKWSKNEWKKLLQQLKKISCKRISFKYGFKNITSTFLRELLKNIKIISAEPEELSLKASAKENVVLSNYFSFELIDEMSAFKEITLQMADVVIPKLTRFKLSLVKNNLFNIHLNENYIIVGLNILAKNNNKKINLEYHYIKRINHTLPLFFINIGSNERTIEFKNIRAGHISDQVFKIIVKNNRNNFEKRFKNQIDIFNRLV